MATRQLLRSNLNRKFRHQESGELFICVAVSVFGDEETLYLLGPKNQIVEESYSSLYLDYKNMPNDTKPKNIIQHWKTETGRSPVS